MAEVLQPDRTEVARAAAMLRAGRLVAFGTETVYGLGADATDAAAVARVFAAKGRPRFNPLICHYPDPAAPFADVALNADARRLANAFWPGPLTLVLPRRDNCRVDLLTGAGLPTLAVRVPSHPIARVLLREAAVPIAAPSANRSGRVSPTTAAHVLADLAGEVDAVLDCGPSLVGLESTVLDLTCAQPVLLRPGGLTREAIEAVIGPVTLRDGHEGVRAPGMLASHYAPSVPVRLNAVCARQDEALLAFGPPPPGTGAVFSLSGHGDLVEAAARLFAGLRILDETCRVRGLCAIAVTPIPEHGLGEAINDRLRRAAAPRPRVVHQG